MHDRIKELAEQAKAQYCDLSDASVFKRLGLVEAVVFTPEDLEKFAELLVRKCANVFWSEECNVSDLAYEEYYRNSMKVKQHFGVEE